MDETEREQYYILLEKMLEHMTAPDYFDRKGFVEVLKEISIMFRLSKGVTEFYESLEMENAGNGEVLIDYDTGAENNKVVIHKRIVTRSQAVIRGTLYMEETESDLSDEELQKVDLILKVLLSFIVRNRLLVAFEKVGYHDDAGYTNLRAFYRHLSQLKLEGRLGGNTTACFNLRHFAAVNQKVGRETGDVLIRDYINTIEMAGGENCMVSRMGGDSFVAIFPRELTDQIVDIFYGIPVSYGENYEQRIRISASAGLYILPDDYTFVHPGEVMEKLISCSMQARREEGGSVLFYNENMLAGRENTVRIQFLFPEAIQNEEFKVFYQPKVDIETGELAGAEALCRWFRDGKIVPPMEFIPVLESTTDICKLDFYMLDHVCRDIRRWLDEGRRAVRVSVNLSRKHLSDVDLLQHIMEVIDRNHVPHEYIEIELTETTTDVGFRDLKRVVGGLQGTGICTSVDDFGIGYSSLNLIREIPWNVLKIDKSFLPLDEESEYSITSLMFKHVIAMARDMGLECITEGVETIKQVQILRKNHCDVAQGYFFDKPLPVEEFENRLSGHIYNVAG